MIAAVRVLVRGAWLQREVLETGDKLWVKFGGVRGPNCLFIPGNPP